MTSLEKLDWQRTLFAATLSRFQLMKLSRSATAPRLRLRVSRNHEFQHLFAALQVFLSFADLEMDIDVGEYDDSLSLRTGPSDLDLIWLDFDRYSALSDADLTDWLCGRLTSIRGETRGPLIVADCPSTTPRGQAINAALLAWSARTPGVSILKLSDLATTLADAFFDERRAHLTGSRYSDAAGLEAARQLGTRIIPSMMAARIKAVALDLDNTLYHGVVGEDGPEGIVLSEAHRALQHLLVELSQKGVLLVVTSRNEPEDVARLFRERDDFPLKPEHIASWQVAWSDKAEGIRRAASLLRIAPDAFLLVDDNIGELTAVSRALPMVKLVFAGHSPEHTVLALEYFPSLWPLALSSTDGLRIADLRANAHREELAARAEAPLDYLRSLGVELRFSMNPMQELTRFADISLKTNQFNLSLSRLSATDIAVYMTSPDRRAVMIFLNDRLADSGSVASLLVRCEGDELVVDDLCISCRALGRRLEDIMVTSTLQRLALDFSTRTIRFAYAIGPRNRPALAWLAAYSSRVIGDEPGTIEMAWDGEAAAIALAEAPVSLEWRA